MTDFRTHTERYNQEYRLGYDRWRCGVLLWLVLATRTRLFSYMYNVQARSDDIELSSICYSFVRVGYDYLFPTKTQRSLRFCPTYQYQPTEFCVLLNGSVIDGQVFNSWYLMLTFQRSTMITVLENVLAYLSPTKN